MNNTIRIAFLCFFAGLSLAGGTAWKLQADTDAVQKQYESLLNRRALWTRAVENDPSDLDAKKYLRRVYDEPLPDPVNPQPYWWLMAGGAAATLFSFMLLGLGIARRR